MTYLDETVAAAGSNRLQEHLRMRSDVENIDLMGRTGFCRNCVADLITEASEGTVTCDASREIVYGMLPPEWKALYQTEATAEPLALMNASSKINNRRRN